MQDRLILLFYSLHTRTLMGDLLKYRWRSYVVMFVVSEM